MYNFTISKRGLVTKFARQMYTCGRVIFLFHIKIQLFSTLNVKSSPSFGDKCPREFFLKFSDRD